MIITLAYVMSACAGLLSYTTAVFLTNFALAYYGGMFGWRVADHTIVVALILMAPFLIPTIVSGLALFRKRRSEPRPSIYQKLSGICGLLIGLLAIPTILMDSDWAFGTSILLTAVTVASPLWVKLVQRSWADYRPAWKRARLSVEHWP